MIPIDIKKEIANRLEQLPDEIRRALFALETVGQIKNISQRNNLNIEQEERLKTEVANVLLVFEHYSNFIENIRRELAIDLAKAQKIGQEINLEIFRPIKQALRIAHGTAEGEFAPPLSIAPKPPPIVPKPPPPLLTPPPPTLPAIIENIKPAMPEKLEERENEAELNREDILRDIENPVLARPARIASLASSAAIASKPEIKEVTSKPNYQDDPYREPLK